MTGPLKRRCIFGFCSAFFQLLVFRSLPRSLPQQHTCKDMIRSFMPRRHAALGWAYHSALPIQLGRRSSSECLIEEGGCEPLCRENIDTQYILRRFTYASTRKIYNILSSQGPKRLKYNSTYLGQINALNRINSASQMAEVIGLITSIGTIVSGAISFAKLLSTLADDIYSESQTTSKYVDKTHPAES